MTKQQAGNGTKVCCIGGGKTRCKLAGEGWAGKVYRPVSNKLSAWIRIEPPQGRAFSRYVPGRNQADAFLLPVKPAWMG